MESEVHETQHELQSYSVCTIVWLALLIMTALSVMFAKMGLGAFGIFMVLLITPAKAMLVLNVPLLFATTKEKVISLERH